MNFTSGYLEMQILFAYLCCFIYLFSILKFLFFSIYFNFIIWQFFYSFILYVSYIFFLFLLLFFTYILIWSDLRFSGKHVVVVVIIMIFKCFYYICYYHYCSPFLSPAICPPTVSQCTLWSPFASVTATDSFSPIYITTPGFSLPHSPCSHPSWSAREHRMESLWMMSRSVTLGHCKPTALTSSMIVCWRDRLGKVISISECTWSIKN